jgi:hypothetical protein
MIIVFVDKIKTVSGYDATFDGYSNTIVSHGINVDTDEHVVLPQVHPSELGAKIDIDVGEWIIP